MDNNDVIGFFKWNSQVHTLYRDGTVTKSLDSGVPYRIRLNNDELEYTYDTVWTKFSDVYPSNFQPLIDLTKLYMSLLFEEQVILPSETKD